MGKDQRKTKRGFGLRGLRLRRADVHPGEPAAAASADAGQDRAAEGSGAAGTAPGTGSGRVRGRRAAIAIVGVLSSITLAAGS